jgi:hypothetical protein
LHFIPVGLELISDLFLADWLCLSGIAADIVFHIKSIPWMVSDTTEYDFNETIELLDQHIPHITERWKSYLSSTPGFPRWRLHRDDFWTQAYSFYHMPYFPIHQELIKSKFIFFKGDFNYRKLVFDCDWELTTSFEEAIGPLHNKNDGEPTNFPPFATLRTCKSAVCVGLTDVQAADLKDVKDWMTAGKYAVISATNFP